MLVAAASQPALIVPHGLTAWDWVHAGIILAVTAALSQIVRQVVPRLGRADHDRSALRLVQRVLTYTVVAVGTVYALGAVHVEIGPLLGALGIGGIALAFAMQDTLQNLVAGVILQARRPFRRGDQVQIDKYEGVVQDVDLRNVALLTYDGLHVFLPNRTVLENPIVNYTRTPTRRTQLTVGVAYGVDLDRAQTVLRDAVAGTPGIETFPAPAAWVHDFGDSSVNFVLLFWHSFDRLSVWQARSAVAIRVRAALAEAGIEIPFPHRVVAVHPATGTAVGRDGADGETRGQPLDLTGGSPDSVRT